MYKNGMLVALMDEYRKSALPYKQILKGIHQDLFVKIITQKYK